MKRSHLLVLPIFAGLAACTSGQPTPATPMPGSDRDAHGCIGSAGYAWCARTHQCERPWELAKEKSFDNTPQAFEEFCRAPKDGT